MQELDNSFGDIYNEISGKWIYLWLGQCPNFDYKYECRCYRPHD